MKEKKTSTEKNETKDSDKKEERESVEIVLTIMILAAKLEG